VSYPCTSCGLCCQKISGIEQLRDLDNGDGVCKNYVPGEGCSIYTSRPNICRIDDGYTLYAKDKMTLIDYYQANAAVCNELQVAENLDIIYRVKL
jgi:Fe-S-cluster containining protein